MGKRKTLSAPSAWQRWLRQPQRLGWRKGLYQIHLWTGIGAGLYIVIISVTGSAVVFRREVARWLLPPGTEVGDSYPVGIRIMNWLVELHDNLLAGELGRHINGVGGILVMCLVLTGAVIWWPGAGGWRRSLTVRRPAKTQRFFWRLHSALGFWGFVLLFGWALTGVYFAFPEPFEWMLDAVDSDPLDFERPGEGLLLALIQLHFGRFGGLSIRVLWVVLGLLPAVLFVSGFVVWWKRVRPQAG